MKIVVMIPTYNEKVNMERMIPTLEEEVFPKIKNHDMWILVADDKSPDKTAEVIEEQMKKWKNIKMIEGNKEGLGAAYVRAMHYAMDEMHADAVVEFDADFQHDPHDIPRLIQAMDDGADYVIGSRYVAGGAIPKEWGLHRKFLSFFGSQFARFVWLKFNVHDMTSGYKLTKTEYLKHIDIDHLLSKYYAYKMHILHDMLHTKAKVKEVPIIFYERKEGSSKISRKDLFDSFYVVFMLRVRDSARFIKFLFVGGTGFILQILITYLVIIIGTPQFIATMIGAEAAILSNFILNNSWTFQDTSSLRQHHGSFLHRLMKFNVASLASIGLQGLASYLSVRLLGPELTIFGHQFHTSLVILVPTIIILVIPLNYIIYNRVIWKTHHLKHGKVAKA